MTAKEFVNNEKINQNEPLNVSEDRWIELMVRFAKIKCKEQREICSNIAYKSNSGIYDTIGINNAPKPEFD